jgi:hypothetical protein
MRRLHRGTARSATPEGSSRDHVHRTLPLAPLPPKILPHPEDDQALVLERVESPLPTGPPLLRHGRWLRARRWRSTTGPVYCLMTRTLGTAHAWISS